MNDKKTFTADELAARLEPRFREQKEAMGRCIAGLTGYAALLAARGQEEQVPRLRQLCIEMAEFWGLTDDLTHNGLREMAERIGGDFDRAVSDTRESGHAPELDGQAIQDAFDGLALHARELRHNDEGLEDWAVECDILAYELEELAAQSGQRELGAAGQEADREPEMGLSP